MCLAEVMMESSTGMTCARCGGQLQMGTFRAISVLVGGVAGQLTAPATEAERSDLRFVHPGTPTAPNVLRAFLQGLREEKDDVELPVTAWRCERCGRLELYAPEEKPKGSS
jgi:hypothetical protein